MTLAARWSAMKSPVTANALRTWLSVRLREYTRALIGQRASRSTVLPTGLRELIRHGDREFQMGVECPMG
jgi:hypothetical protein